MSENDRDAVLARAKLDQDSAALVMFLRGFDLDTILSSRKKLGMRMMEVYRRVSGDTDSSVSIKTIMPLRDEASIPIGDLAIVLALADLGMRFAGSRVEADLP